MCMANGIELLNMFNVFIVVLIYNVEIKGKKKRQISVEQ